jgi:seryl-tRNA synthetase
MPIVSIKGKLDNEEYKRFKEIQAKTNSQIEVLRFLLRTQNKPIMTFEEKNRLIEEVQNLKAELQNLKNFLNDIDERLNIAISILSYSGS